MKTCIKKSIIKIQKSLPPKKPSITSKNASFLIVSSAGFYDTNYDTKKEDNKRNERKNLENNHNKTRFLVRSQSVAPIIQKQKDAFLQAFFCFYCPCRYDTEYDTITGVLI